MSYVFDFNDSNLYEAWMKNQRSDLDVELEGRLLLDLLQPQRGETILDIGCGTGLGIYPLMEAGLQITAIDPSPYMLDIASRNLGTRVDYYRGAGEDLPFEDNSFNYACLISTLEFVENPQKTIAEAARVAKDKLFIGVFNRYAIKSVERRVMGVFHHTFFNRARFFSIWEIKHMVRTLLGDVPISWRTVCQFPGIFSHFTGGLEKSNLVQRCPFGTFAGVVVTLLPRFRTRPLAARYRSKQTPGMIPG